jgi:hypothetical protein
MPNITQIPAPRVPIIDEKTGLMSREWYRFFINIFQLTGSGSNNVSLEDLQVAPVPVETTPTSPNNTVQYNNAGAFAGSSNFTYDSATNTLTVGNITGSALAMTIQPRAPTALESGGTLTIRGQDATAATRSGGSLNIVAGNGSTTGNGGGITFSTGGGAVGGAIAMNVGSSNSGNGAGFSMVAGVGQAFGGGFDLTAGSASSINGVGGSFVMQGGSASNTGGIGGDFTFAAGSGGTGAGARSGTLIFASPVAPTYAFQVGDDGANATIRFFADTSGLDLVTQRPAYTQTFSTASRTVSNPTFTNLATTAATNVTPWGFSTQAQADAIATKVNQLAADVVILRQLINSLIDDSQAYGLAQ